MKKNEYVRRKRYIIDIILNSEATHPKVVFRKIIDRTEMTFGDAGHGLQRESNV